MKNKFFLILAGGILLRLLLAATTFHFDMQHFFLAGRVIGQGNILNFYDASQAIFNYPPVVYFTLGPLAYLLTLPFGETLHQGLALDPATILGNPGFNFMLLAMKFPYLVFDIGVGLLLYRFFDNPKNKLLALTLWMVNPFSLYASFMMGQFDIIPTFFVVLVLYLLKKKNIQASPLLLEAVLLGLGASYKIFPFLFLVPLALLKTKWFDRLKVLGAGVATYILFMLPFISSPGYRANALVAAQTTKSFFANIPISGGEAIVLFPFVMLLMYIYLLYRGMPRENVWRVFFVVLLPFFIFTHYHPQWFLWLSPFLILDLVTTRFKHWILLVISMVSFLGLLAFFDPGLTVWLFSPVAPSLFGKPGLAEILGPTFDAMYVKSLLQTLFVSVAAYYIYYYGRKSET